MPNKQLVRPQEGRVLFGVCAGLAQYFNIDPTLVRILWVLLTFIGGSGILLYIVLAIVMPSGGASVITAAVDAATDAATAVGDAAKSATKTAADAAASLGSEVVEKVETAIDRATTDAGGTGGGGSVA